MQASSRPSSNLRVGVLDGHLTYAFPRTKEPPRSISAGGSRLSNPSNPQVFVARRTSPAAPTPWEVHSSAIEAPLGAASTRRQRYVHFVAFMIGALGVHMRVSFGLCGLHWILRSHACERVQLCPLIERVASWAGGPRASVRTAAMNLPCARSLS